MAYSSTGALIKKIVVAAGLRQAEQGSTCQVAASGRHAVIMYTQFTGYSRTGPARQIYVVRINPDLSVSKPVAVLAPGVGQSTSFPDDDNAEVSVSPTGWTAVAWVDNTVTKRVGLRTAQTWQWRMSWISPSGAVGPAFPLAPAVSQHLCKLSNTCDNPPVPVVNAMGSHRALVVFGSPHLYSEEVDAAGQRSAATTLSRSLAFTTPDGGPGTSSQVAASGGTVAVTWISGSVHHAVASVATWRHGKWSRPVLLARATATQYPEDDPVATVNTHGKAAVLLSMPSFSLRGTGHFEAFFEN